VHIYDNSVLFNLSRYKLESVLLSL
jgi:hypothetical protein